MSKVICEREDLVAVADAIRNKTGETNQMTLNEMSNYINSISIGNKEGHATIYLKDISMAFTCSCECLLNDLSYYNQALKNNMNAFVA